jgi:hypothetical protein
MALNRFRRLRSRRSNETFEEWDRETGGKKLPEHVARRAKASRRAKPRRRKTSREAGKMTRLRNQAGAGSALRRDRFLRARAEHRQRGRNRRRGSHGHERQANGPTLFVGEPAGNEQPDAHTEQRASHDDEAEGRQIDVDGFHVALQRFEHVSDEVAPRLCFDVEHTPCHQNSGNVSELRKGPVEFEAGETAAIRPEAYLQAPRQRHGY